MLTSILGSDIASLLFIFCHRIIKMAQNNYYVTDIRSKIAIFLKNNSNLECVVGNNSFAKGI